MTDKTRGKKQLPVVGWVERCQKETCGFRSVDGRCLYRKGVVMDVGGCCMSDRLFGKKPYLPVRKFIHWKKKDGVSTK